MRESNQLLLEKDYTRVVRKGNGKAYGTFGELLQGVLPENRDFLVTLPINRYSQCEFISMPESKELSIYPSNQTKSLEMAKQILQFYNLPMGGVIKIYSELSKGKGLASSTADMVAVSRAIESCFEINIPNSTLEILLSRIEPSDGVMYPGIVSFYHKEVKVRELIADCPPLTIMALDEGGRVDTVTFNNLPKPFNLEEKQEYQKLLDQMVFSLRNKDLNLLGEVTTRSAELNQKLHRKQTFEQVRSICEAIEGLGVVIAHSGTYVGILISNTDPFYSQKIAAGVLKLRALGYPTSIFHTISSFCTQEGGGK
ncbi:kinase [Bacillus paranthracis]|uniref:GHMP family kinase ATP-binding protein n=1 Tax=Bacillus paranthracis TaxID=2026186 RepID=UPI0010FF9919|nr:kinase [Bacillus paranthracis]QCU08578.1 kinase [Bacillus paranthracis]